MKFLLSHGRLYPVPKIPKYLIYIFRYGNFEDFLKRMEEVEGGVEKMSEAFKTMGCHVKDDNTFICRQWAPGAQVKIEIFRQN